jgi:hypothetical protein
MKVKDVLLRNPKEFQLPNQGQARLAATDELQSELSTFVCEGQYADGMQRIIQSFLQNSQHTSQRGAWVSGFFGSGKSHLLKMLCHLWQDTALQDGATARSLVPSMPEDLRALLRELDTAGKRAGGLLAAAGALPGGTTDNVRLTILAILFRAVGLPEQYPQARFCLWLHIQGYFNKVKASVEAAGKNFDKELNNLYVSGPIARAVMASDPAFAKTEADAKQLIKGQFPPQPTDITTALFLSSAKDALRLKARDGKLPCTLLILDEAQQYIGDSQQRASLVTEVTEAVSKQLDSQMMVVAAGQSALTEMPLLTYLLDRFTVRVALSDAEVETVTRKVLLAKKASAIADVKAVLNNHAGEISRHLHGTKISQRTEDNSVIVEDYPLLPVRRRFWEDCFRQLDVAGTNSQLRSQLRIIYDVVAKLSEQPLGAVVPADTLFDALAPDLVNNGVLLREINETIIQLGASHGLLARRICGLIFLIGRLKREGGADIGVRANKDHLADLLIDDLAKDNAKLRDEVATVLQTLTTEGKLMFVGDEYRLQTREGSEWDREFRNAQSRIGNSEKDIQFKRDTLLYAEVDKIMRGIRLVQGDAKEPRQFLLHRDQTPPPAEGTAIPVWVRDSWSSSESEMTNAARAATSASPVLFVHIPKQSAEALKRLIVDAEAAKSTLDTKGVPTTPEGLEARRGMESRRSRAEVERDRLIREIVGIARVFQGGGSEIMSATFEEKIRNGAADALIRLFPRFKEADYKDWEGVMKRARDGADHPFQPSGHTDATERHPVCQQVLTTIGAGNPGNEIRKVLGASPYGWPRDAVDAALIALHRGQHITATLNGAAVALGQLDQNKIAKADFRTERATLSVQDRIKLRKLFQSLGITCKSGDEGARAPEYLGRLIALARDAGGEAPLPPAPDVTAIEDVQRLHGNEQLVAILAKGSDWERDAKAWSTARVLAEARLPAWHLVERLTRHAVGTAEATPLIDQIDAIRTRRLLLEATDSVGALRLGLCGLLRRATQEIQLALQSSHENSQAVLAASEVWGKLSLANRQTILATVGLLSPGSIDVSTDEALAAHLDAKPIAGAHAEIDAVPSRVARAIEMAAKQLEPKIQTVAVETGITLNTEADVETWTQRQKAILIAAVRKGPVLVK